MSDWQNRYGLVRMMGERPVAHRWVPRALSNALATPCGIADAEGRGYSLVLLANLAPEIRRCRRCWR